MKLLIATHNNKKRVELQRILSPLGIEVVLAEDIGCDLRDVEETGTTFEENAKLKAVAGCEDSGIACIADDSGLCVDFPDGKIKTVRGECEGEILTERHGNGGFGYDPIFMANGKPFGEITSEEKDNMSHRGNALRLMAEELKKIITE